MHSGSRYVLRRAYWSKHNSGNQASPSTNMGNWVVLDWWMCFGEGRRYQSWLTKIGHLNPGICSPAPNFKHSSGLGGVNVMQARWALSMYMYRSVISASSKVAPFSTCCLAQGTDRRSRKMEFAAAGNWAFAEPCKLQFYERSRSTYTPAPILNLTQAAYEPSP